MIGMMYLVLTAMLALNVSTDVLNAFALVDNSLHTTMDATEVRNKVMMSEFRAMRDDNPQKNGEWYDKAAQLTERSDSLYNFIQNVKYQIVLATDKKKADPEARYVEGKDNRDAASHYALPNVGEQPGVVLRGKIEEYRDYLCGLDTARAAEFGATFDTSSKPGKDGEMLTWEHQMFHDMPSGAAVVLMTKLQNDVRNAQLEMIQYLRKQTDAGDLRVNKLNAYVIPKSDYVIKGGRYHAQIVLAAIDSTQTPEYYVEGQRLNDQGIYEAVASTVGHKKYSGWISYEDPSSGETKKLPFSSEYSVGEPAVTISNTDLNIMYRGYDNKFAISVPGVSNDKIKVSVSGGSVKQSNGLWIIVPGEVNNVKITVSAEIEGKMLPMGVKDYRVKRLPDPQAYFSAREKEYASGSNIPPSTLTHSSGVIIASYGPDGLLNVPFKVTSFRTIINGSTTNSNGNKFSQDQLNQIGKLKKGGLVVLQDIRAMGPGGEKRLSPVLLTLN
ncbi:MAG: gliding motility protein GldM [Paludibacteraceae bacterium]|nr:gliding motility protein GldM [Paludibacteraceae bacterium]